MFYEDGSDTGSDSAATHTDEQQDQEKAEGGEGGEGGQM